MTLSSMEQARPINEPELAPSTLRFPVVGLGASAGGLPALLRFFEHMPAHNGMAFVVILHLSPKHQSSADNVLQRATRMPVVQVTERTAIRPEHVYVIGPNMHLSMDDGHIEVRELERPRGQHVAIDIFFRTLADVHRERSFAIVLSGTGTDGSVGLERIKEQGGLTLVQAPDDAEHDGMPQAAIDTGMVDFVLPAAEIPQKLVDLWNNARRIHLPPAGDGDGGVAADTDDEAERVNSEAALQRIITMLCANTGHDFRHYKRATVLRRIERRLQVGEERIVPAERVTAAKGKLVDVMAGRPDLDARLRAQDDSADFQRAEPLKCRCDLLDQRLAQCVAFFRMVEGDDARRIPLLGQNESH